MSRNLESALAYAQRFNFAVLPLHSVTVNGCSCNNVNCKHVAKHPRNFNGVHGATKDINQIIEWWTKWPDANIGIATGEVSGITVLDVDIKDRVDGREVIKRLEDFYGLLPIAPFQTSGSGGWHYFFQYEPLVKTGVEVLPGIDIRNKGSYIIAAPSLHETRVNYRWDKSRHIANIMPQRMPKWLLDILSKNVSQTSSKTDMNNDKWGRLIKGINEGGRNDAATSLAGHLFYKKVDLSIILWVMENWNKQNIPPLEADELEKVILSVARMQGVHI